MNGDYHSLDLEGTLQRMEEGVSVPPVEQSLASIAISLKRLADELEENSITVALANRLESVVSAISMNTQAIHNHSTKIAPIPPLTTRST